MKPGDMTEKFRSGFVRVTPTQGNHPLDDAFKSVGGTTPGSPLVFIHPPQGQPRPRVDMRTCKWR
jgi:hypothetical protein